MARKFKFLVNNTALNVWAGATTPITNRNVGKINAHLGAQYTRLLNIRLLSFLRTTTSHYASTMGPMTFWCLITPPRSSKISEKNVST